jgi:hemerythrin-like domain-containing protein
MKPSDVLMSEHRVIEQVLGCLDKMADSAFEAGTLDVEGARDAISFIRTFADGCHHKKEEDRLFPALERHGMPHDAGPTSVMRHEHDLGRANVKRMDDAVSAFVRGDATAADRFAFEARGFCELLRDHIAKEDQVLFPMADRMLPPAVQDELMRSFEHAEKHEMGAGTREKFLAVAERLGARYGVSRSTQAVGSCACHHGN